MCICTYCRDAAHTHRHTHTDTHTSSDYWTVYKKFASQSLHNRIFFKKKSGETKDSVIFLFYFLLPTVLTFWKESFDCRQAFGMHRGGGFTCRGGTHSITHLRGSCRGGGHLLRRGRTRTAYFASDRTRYACFGTRISVELRVKFRRRERVAGTSPQLPLSATSCDANGASDL